MAKFMLDGREYCGSGSGVSTVKLTQAEYDALSDEKLSNNVIYIITDSDELSAKNVPYDGSVTGLGNNVQSAIDELNSKSNQYAVLSPSAITDLVSLGEIGKYTIVPLKIDYQGSDEYSVTHNGGINHSGGGMYSISGKIWFSECTDSKMMQVTLWTWDSVNGDKQVLSAINGESLSGGYLTLIIPRVFLDLTDKVLFVKVRNVGSLVGKVPADATTQIFIEKM